MPVTSVKTRWSSGALIFHEATTLATIGDILTIDTDTITVGSATNDVDLLIYQGASDQYTKFDCGAATATFAKVDVTINGDLTIDLEDIQLGDDNYLQFGDATGGDVYLSWVSASTALICLPATDDTGVIQIGNGTKDIDVRIYLGTNAKYVDFNVGDSSLVCSAGITLSSDDTTDASSTTTGSIHTDGGIGVAKKVYIGTDLNFPNASDVVVKANTATTLEFYDGTTKFIAVDSRNTVTAVDMVTVVGIPATITAASGIQRRILRINSGTTTLTGSTGVTNMTGIGLYVDAPALTDSSAVTVAQASTVYIAGAPTAGGSVTVTTGVALEVASGISLFEGNVEFGVDATGIDVNFRGAVTAYKVWFDANGDTNGAWYFGADTKGILTQWYGDTTGYYVQFDPSGDTNGAWYFGADTLGIQVNLYGDVTGCGVFWDPSTDTNGTLTIGGSGGSKGVDVLMYGNTNGAYVHWDQSTDDLYVVGAAQLLVTSGLLSVGADTVAGTITLYPSTTASGITTITMNDNSGATTTNIDVAAQAGARTYTIPDTGDTASSFLMTDSTTMWWPMALGVCGEDTDGVFTNSGGICGGNPDSSTNQFNDSGGTVFVKVYDFGTTTWDDLSTSSNLTHWTSNYQLMPDAASEEANDAFAIGFASKFCQVGFDDLATGGGTLATHGGDSGQWEYSTGAGTWSALTVFDNTDSTAQDGKRPLQRVGCISFAPPSDWALATYDGQEAYWIQWKVTAAQITQSAIIDDTNKDEPFIIVPNADAFDPPFKCSITRVRVTDMNATLHDQVIKFVVFNYTDGTYVNEMSWPASQKYDTFTLSSALAADPGDIIGVIITEDTASTNNPAIMMELELSLED